MTRYRLISFKTCPWVQRAAIVLREKKVEFELVHIESANRPSWFGAISPHGKVPVLQIDGTLALFESNAIAEYLDDGILPRLHPDDPIERAINRAWAEYIPAFSGLIGAISGAATEEALTSAWQQLFKAFTGLEAALRNSDRGPYFNGERYSLLDAGYAPFLQRYLILESLVAETPSLEFPKIGRWARALVDRPSTHTFPPDVFRVLYLETARRRGGIIAQRAQEREAG